MCFAICFCLLLFILSQCIFVNNSFWLWWSPISFFFPFIDYALDTKSNSLPRPRIQIFSPTFILIYSFTFNSVVYFESFVEGMRFRLRFSFFLFVCFFFASGCPCLTALFVEKLYFLHWIVSKPLLKSVGHMWLNLISFYVSID